MNDDSTKRKALLDAWRATYAAFVTCLEAQEAVQLLEKAEQEKQVAYISKLRTLEQLTGHSVDNAQVRAVGTVLMAMEDEAEAQKEAQNDGQR